MTDKRKPIPIHCSTQWRPPCDKLPKNAENYWAGWVVEQVGSLQFQGKITKKHTSYKNQICRGGNDNLSRSLWKEFTG